MRGVCACGRGIFALCHRGADVSDPRPCALRLRLCSTTRPFYPVAHFARPPTAGTATAQVESTHSFGYASCGPIVGTGGLLSSVLTSVHELSHVATCCLIYPLHSASSCAKPACRACGTIFVSMDRRPMAWVVRNHARPSKWVNVIVLWSCAVLARSCPPVRQSPLARRRTALTGAPGRLTSPVVHDEAQ